MSKRLTKVELLALLVTLFLFVALLLEYFIHPQITSTDLFIFIYLGAFGGSISRHYRLRPHFAVHSFDYRQLYGSEGLLSFISFMMGGAFALVLCLVLIYVTLRTRITVYPVFPKFTTHQPSDDLIVTFLKTPTSDLMQFAKLCFWSFFAGFGERFVLSYRNNRLNEAGPPYAIDEVPYLLHQLTSTEAATVENPTIRYVCALFAELAYYHVPQYEIDDKKRAKFIPCEAYGAIVSEGNPSDVSYILTVLLKETGFKESFVVEDRGVVAVGLAINGFLFIGFRGTQFLFDWRINLQARLIPIESNFLAPYNGRYHSGLYEEAIRVSYKIRNAIQNLGSGQFNRIFLTGHSLGGAVAAIAENLIGVAPLSVCIFGSPRYCDAPAYSISTRKILPTQIRRPGDMVPTVPPRSFGYADHPNEFTTIGRPYIETAKQLPLVSELSNWIKFLTKFFRPHSMESYRVELGVSATARNSFSPLAPYRRLTTDDIA